MNQRKSTNINGVSLSYFEFGNNLATTILILHGWGLSAFVYLELAKLISTKGYHVVVVDIPGFGYSTAPHEKWNYGQYAACISKFIDKVDENKKKVTILGHSFGGGIGLALASKYFSQIDKLILADSTGIPINLSILLLGTKKLVEMLIQFFLPEGFIPSAKMTLVFLINVLRNPLAMYHTLELSNRHDLTSLLSEIRVPISVFWAKNDMVVTGEKGQLISELTKSPIIFAPDFLYHDWCITHPKVFVEKLIL